VLDAVSYGVPQFRKRLFIVGRRKERPDEWLRRQPIEWPAARPKDEWITLESAIGDLPFSTPPCLEEKRTYDRPDDPTIYQRLMRQNVPDEDRGFVYDHVVRPVREDDQAVFAIMKPGDKYTDVPVEYRRYDDSKFEDKYYKLRPEVPGNTITAHMAKDGYRYIHWDSKQHRTLSPREAARIQSFGDHFRFTGSRTSRYRMIGNAVPPLLARALAEQIHKAWRDDSAGEWRLGREEG
jgi:DNA (cytosine-5)-methyltransferase 1